MDENEFRRILDLFLVVRSRDYCLQDGSGRASSSQSQEDEVKEWAKGWTEMDGLDELKENDGEDPFWGKLRAAAERKVGPANAERFCAVFKTVHEKLVYKELSLEAAQRLIGTDKTDSSY